METILEGYSDQKVDCPYCSQRDLEKEKAIAKWEAENNPPLKEETEKIDLPF